MLIETQTAQRIYLGCGEAFTTSLPRWQLTALEVYVRTLYNGGERVKAIKRAREELNCGLKHAKLFTEQAASEDVEYGV